MKVLIISDLHLGFSFDSIKCKYLIELFTEYDKIIIAGDFWDNTFYSFDKFLDSRWQPLLHVLRKKYVIYLPGNHDHYQKLDSRIYDYVSELKTFHHEKFGDYELFISHGHVKPNTKENETVHEFKESKSSILSILNSFLHIIFDIPIKYTLKYNKIRRKLTLFNHQQKKWVKYLRKNGSSITPETVFVFGHTHIQEKDDHAKYINLGVNKYGVSEYLSIDSKEKELLLISTTYNQAQK